MCLTYQIIQYLLKLDSISMELPILQGLFILENRQHMRKPVTLRYVVLDQILYFYVYSVT